MLPAATSPAVVFEPSPVPAATAVDFPQWHDTDTEPPPSPSSFETADFPSDSEEEFGETLEDDDPDEEEDRKVNVTSDRTQRGVVAPLPNRPALKVISRVLFIIGIVFFAIAAIIVLLAVYGAAVNYEQDREVVQPLVFGFLPIAVGVVFSGVIWIACSELISLMLALEARQYEISRNTVR